MAVEIQRAIASCATAGGLIGLNESKVPKDLIKLMMASPRGAVTTAQAPAVAVTPATATPVATDTPATQPRGAPSARSNAAKRVTASPPAPRKPKALLTELPTEAGIHVRADGMDLTLLEPTVFSSGRTSNVLGAALTSGISKAKMKAVVSSAEASLRICDANVEFYFVFEKQTGSLANAGQWWSSLTSPNEFTLIRLDKKDNRREVVTAAMGAFGAQTGTDEKAVIPFTLTRIKPGVYRVVPRSPLAPGEYAFFPASIGGAGTAGANRLFDFGVDER